MVQIFDKTMCSGCSACAQMCPQKCILMEEDDEGFLYPKVLINECVHCNMCDSICPITNHISYKDEVIAAYAGLVNDDNIRLSSSSGGIFSVLAKAVLEMDGVVFGAALNDSHDCCHILIEHEKDLYKLQGSKYVQSTIEDCYIRAKDYLEKGRWVLFSGTACQCAGLKALLKKDYRNLILIDVLCHGVPSPKVWKKYLSNIEIEKGKNISKIFFRSKKNGWKDWAIKLIFHDDDEYEKINREDPYIDLFLSDICLRPSCHNCHFKKLERPSDISLGDAWGIQRTMPCLDDDKGTSVVLIHTQKGVEIFEHIKNHLVYREMAVDVLLPPNADSRKSVEPHPNRKKLFKRLKQGADWKSIYEAKRLTLYDRILIKMHKLIKLLKGIR